MKIDKAIYVPRAEKEKTEEIFRCFGWETAGASGDPGAPDGIVRLMFQRSTELPHYAEIVKLEAKYRAAEAEIREIAECAAAGAVNLPAAAALFACLIVPGIVYVAKRRKKAGGKAVSQRVEALTRKKEFLKREAARLLAEK